MNEDRRLRLFFALPVPGADALLRKVYERLAAFPRQLKAVAPGHYHLTLKFLGDTDPEDALRLRNEFRALDPSITAQPCVLKGLGAFPGIRRPRVIWCGLDTDTGALHRAQRAIEDLASRYGFPRESRPFTPHLTLGRIRGEGTAPDELCRYLAGNVATVYGDSRLERIVLFKSDLKSEGPVYTVLEEVRLA